MDKNIDPIWGGKCPATVTFDSSNNIYYVSESPRTGGGYVLPIRSAHILSNMSAEKKARLTTWLIDQRLRDTKLPNVSEYFNLDTHNKTALLFEKRASRLLQFLVTEYPHYLDERIVLGDPSSVLILMSLAWSESVNIRDLMFFCEYFEEQRWIKNLANMLGGSHCSFQIAPAGYIQIEKQLSRTNSNQAFVAMWFDSSVKEAYYQAIKPAIEQTGYIPKRIDEDRTVDKIDDAIIAEIRRSAFVIADFTHGNEGARGGVYYEAGFAYGLKLPVIFTCRKDMVSKLHFDTRQHAHILWEDHDLEKFKRELVSRIAARISERTQK